MRWGRKVATLFGAGALAAALTWLRAGPVPTDGYEPTGPALSAAAGNVARMLKGAGFEVEPEMIRLVESPDGIGGLGRSTMAWFTASTGSGRTDLFSCPLSLSRRGVPLAVGVVTKVTATPEVDEGLLYVGPDIVVFSVGSNDGISQVVALDFSDHQSLKGLDAALAARVAVAQYGVPRGPARYDVRLGAPAQVVEGRADGGHLILKIDERPVQVTLASLSVSPLGAAMVYGPPDSGPPLAVRLLRWVGTSPVIQGEVRLGLGAWLGAQDWARRLRHTLVPGAGDERALGAGAEPLGHAHWPPPSIVVPDGLPGEGRWGPVLSARPEARRSVRETFLRVDARRPYARVRLFAFDSRCLRLGFAAGRDGPMSADGRRGSGRVPDHARAGLVAAFNGGVSTPHEGQIDDGLVLVPPRLGVATVVTDAEGATGFGLWDGEALGPPWRALRQSLTPLVVDGEVAPVTRPRWGVASGLLPNAVASRSGLGLTAAGVLIYAWSDQATAAQLGEALRRAGVTFGLHLAMTPHETGVALYRRGTDGLIEGRGAPKMSFRGGRWLGVAPEDFFYLTLSVSAPPPIEGVEVSPPTSPDGPGRWRPLAGRGAFNGLARTHLDAARFGGTGEVELLWLDLRRLRPHVVPGLAERRPAEWAIADELSLSSAPRLWIELGRRGLRTSFGMVASGDVWRAPALGELTLAVEAGGETRLGALGEGALPLDGDWRDLLQGPALVVDGVLVDQPAGEVVAPWAGEAPVVAAGRTPGGALLLSITERGQARIAGEALLSLGVTDALLLGERPTVDTGAYRTFHYLEGRLWASEGGDAPLSAARLAPGAGSGLVFTSRPQAPSAKIVERFRTWDE